jgi:hypothetical protein
MGCGMDGPGFDSVGEREYSILQNFQTESWVHPASYLMDTAIFFVRVKRPRRENLVHLEARLNLSGAVPLLPHMPSGHGKEKLLFRLQLSFASALFLCFPTKILYGCLFSPTHAT